ITGFTTSCTSCSTKTRKCLWAEHIMAAPKLPPARMINLDFSAHIPSQFLSHTLPKKTTIPANEMNTQKSIFHTFCFLICALFVVTTATAQTQTTQQSVPKYKNPNLSIEDRVADLLP